MMPSVDLRYSLVTPARDEAANLQRLFSSLVAQTVLPSEWVIVDNGSGDETREVVSGFDEEWIRLASVAGEERPAPGAPVVRAFNAGLAELAVVPDVVVKLDADVSFEPTYFERLLEAFQSERWLGIASGACLELEEGEWRPVRVTGGHVRGAARAYRWACLQDVLPLEERVGWDGIDELKASVLGWRTGTVPDLAFKHHRAMGARDGGRHVRWVRQGAASYYMGYRPSYLLFRTIHRSLGDPAAVAMIGGYVRAALSGAPRYPNEAVRQYLRREQSLRSLPKRLQEVRGRHSASAASESAKALKRVDVLLVCSAGGHLHELHLLRRAWRGHSHIWVTHDKGDSRSLLAAEPVVYAFGPTTRNAPNFIRNLRLALRVIGRARPQVILTTGAGVAVPFAWVGRLFGARVVYVESFTRIDRPSLSCRLIAPIADRVYVQWPELAGRVRHGKYIGNVLGS